MRGNRGEVWDSVACRAAGEADRRKSAKAANDAVGEGAAAQAEAKAEGEDMFTRAGVAAE
jgi:hypothetical protein